MKYCKNKAHAVVLYIISRCENKQIDLLHLFKIIYFADMDHVNTFGRPILNDNYIAMKNGPVPSNLYDNIKAIDLPYYPGDDVFRKSISKEGHVIKSDSAPDLDELSVSDRRCLDKSFYDNIELNFSQLSDKSHDSAWNSADLNNQIDFLEIAKAGGADEAMVEYISMKGYQ